ncbi:hypothetical protein [Paraburkholderia youngii]|uniref:hypothetical protein n=1 Tax=Paraburkholderia youngii TaxID=2782701 RepID=UPI003D1DFDAE
MNIVHQAGAQENPFPENFTNQWLAHDAAVELLCDDPTVNETVVVRMDESDEGTRYTTIETIRQNSIEVVNARLRRFEQETKLILLVYLGSVGEEVIRHFHADPILGLIYTLVFSQDVRDAIAKQACDAFADEAFRATCLGARAHEHFESFVRHAAKDQLDKRLPNHAAALPAAFTRPA